MTCTHTYTQLHFAVDLNSTVYQVVAINLTCNRLKILRKSTEEGSRDAETYQRTTATTGATVRGTDTGGKEGGEDHLVLRSNCTGPSGMEMVQPTFSSFAVLNST